MTPQDYYFPALFLVPQFEEAEIDAPNYRVIRRRWETTTFDLATLASRHNLHLPYQAMDLFLASCNIEFSVKQQPSLEQAIQSFQNLRLSLYTRGVSPFLAPFITNHSINDYSGINSRDSESLREKLPPEMRAGLTSKAGTVEAWPLQLSFSCIVNREKRGLSATDFERASQDATVWESLALEDPILRVLEGIANASPTLISLDQSLLHIWAGLEALFPAISAELSFKLALYLAQLSGTERDRLAYFTRVKKAYSLRSKVTHGTKRGVSFDQWLEAWTILMDAINSIMSRGRLPDEEALLAGVLGGYEGEIR